MKRALSVFAAAVLLLFASIGVGASSSYPKATKRFFVNDYANVISDSAEEEIYSRAAALYEKTEAQAVVVAVENLNGEQPSDYALGLGREWGVGSKDDNNGVVILFALEERQIYIAVGYGLEGALPDSKTGRIIDNYGLDYLREDNFSEGLLQISKAVINEIYIEYDLTPEEGYTPIEDIEEEDEGGARVIISWLVLLVLVALYLKFFKHRRGIIFFGGRGGFGGFSGGSFGGHSGGGSGFSGGGGSFGGGGAGRGF